MQIKTIILALADISLNLSSTWLAIILISPGFFGVSQEFFLDLLISNLPPAILTLITGIILRERANNEY